MFTHSHCWHSHHRMYVLPARARVGTKGERKIFVRKLSFEKINIFVSSPLPSHSTVTVESCISLFMWCGWWRNGNISYIFIYQKTELRAKKKTRNCERERTLNSETGNFSSSQHGKTKMKWMWYGQHEQQNSVLVGVVSLSSSGMSHVQHDHE